MKSMINISDFNEIVNGIKAMKADYVTVYGNLLLGTDKTMSILKVYQLSHVISLPVTIITKELSSKFFANIIDTTIVFDTDELKIYCPDHKSYADEANPMLDLNITNSIICIYNRLNENINNSKVYLFNDITNDTYFQQLKTLKTSDGTFIYEPNGVKEYAMYLYNGSIPLNKNDQVSLNIYDQGDTFISQFIVYKKKLNPIYTYFRFVKIR